MESIIENILALWQTVQLISIWSVRIWSYIANFETSLVGKIILSDEIVPL